MLDKDKVSKVVEILDADSDYLALRKKVVDTVLTEELVYILNGDYHLFENIYTVDFAVNLTKAYLYDIAAQAITVDYLKKHVAFGFVLPGLSASTITDRINLTYTKTSDSSLGGIITNAHTFAGTYFPGRKFLPVDLKAVNVKVVLVITINPNTPEVLAGEITKSSVNCVIKTNFLEKFDGTEWGSLKNAGNIELSKLDAKALKSALKASLYECNDLVNKILSAREALRSK